MNKTQLIRAVAEKSGLTQKQAEAAVNGALESVTAALAAGEKVAIAGFGTYEVKERGERTARNPRTGETVAVAASKVPAFHAGKALKDAVSGK